VERVRLGAAVEDVGIGAFVASTVRQMLDHAEEGVRLGLLGRMSGSLRPGVAALEAMLARVLGFVVEKLGIEDVPLVACVGRFMLLARFARTRAVEGTRYPRGNVICIRISSGEFRDL
jgi:hypothetical protein